MKVGDKVKVTDFRNEYYRETGTVVTIENGLCKLAEVEFDGGSKLVFNKHDLETIKPPKDHTKANAARRARNELYRDLGMKRVRGNLGGVYYE